jgi:hypothetical protein
MNNAHAHTCNTCLEIAAEIVGDMLDDDNYEGAPQTATEYLDMIVRNQQHTMTTNATTCSVLHDDWY